MPMTLSIDEGAPETWPQIDPDDDEAIPATESDGEPDLWRYARAAWLRIESWVAYRWNVRSGVFIVEGPGNWLPPLTPFTATQIEIWSDDDWTTVTLAPTALGGFVLDQIGPYQFTGNLGSENAPPETIRQAVKRLAEYFQSADDMLADDRSLTTGRVNIGEFSVEQARNPLWIARAIQQSGAADLLRPWRRLGSR